MVDTPRAGQTPVLPETPVPDSQQVQVLAGTSNLFGVADEKDAQWDRQALADLSITAMTPMNLRRAFASDHLTPEPHIRRSKTQPFRVLSGNKRREESRLSV